VNVAADSAQMRAGNYETEFFPSYYSTASPKPRIDPKFLVSIAPNRPTRVTILTKYDHHPV
jgi:hypothetical protein